MRRSDANPKKKTKKKKHWVGGVRRGKKERARAKEQTLVAAPSSGTHAGDSKRQGKNQQEDGPLRSWCGRGTGNERSWQ